MTSGEKNIFQKYYQYRFMFVLLLPALIAVFIFEYLPMYGVLIAFKKYRVLEGIWGSPWVGLENFGRLFSATSAFSQVFYNTVIISFYKLFFGFPAPIILALLLNEVKHLAYKKVTQTISYLPHFLSWVILGGIFTIFLSPSSGIINQIIQFLGFEPIYFLANKDWFRTILITTGIWQSVGWGTIIYLAAISGIDSQMYEAAVMDGAGRFKQAIYITIPSITNVMVILFILNIGGFMSAGFDQIFNLYNPVVYEVADIIDTYVYRVGLIGMDFSFAATAGLFKSLIGITLVLLTNAVAKKFGEHGIW